MHYRYFSRGQRKGINYLFWFFFFCFGQGIILAAAEYDYLEHYSGVQLSDPDSKSQKPEERLRELKTWMYLYAYGTAWEPSKTFYAVRAFEKNSSQLKKKLAISDMKLDKSIPYFFHFKKEDCCLHKQQLTNFKYILNSLRADKSTFEFFVCKIEIKNNSRKYVKKIEDSEIEQSYFYDYNLGSFEDRDKGWFSSPKFWSIDRRDIFEERDYSELEEQEKKNSESKKLLKESNEENKLEDFSERDPQRAKLRRYVFYLTLLAMAYKLGTMHIHTSIKEFLQRKMHPSPSL